MKTEIVNTTRSWQPVSIQLTFETKSELAAWLLMTNDWTRQRDEIVAQELEGNPEFEKYGPLKVNFYILGEHWHELKRALDN